MALRTHNAPRNGPDASYLNSSSPHDFFIKFLRLAVLVYVGYAAANNFMEAEIRL